MRTPPPLTTHRATAAQPGAARRGFALLLALAALVLVLAALGAGLSALQGAQQVAAVGDTDDRLRDGLRAGEALASAWIARRGRELVLPPAGGGALAAHDRLLTAAGATEVSVVVYDGLAGIPAHLAQLGGALRFALPDAFTGIVVPRQAPAVPGGGSDLIERIALGDGVPRFPAAPGGQPRAWRGADAPVDDGAMPAPAPAAAASLAEVLSAHSDGRVNCNTAPAELLRQVYRELGLGDVEALLERRRQGTFTAAAAAPGDAAGDGVRLVDRSDTWQALITVAVQGVQRRWWVVIAGNPPDLRIVQRHDAGR